MLAATDRRQANYALRRAAGASRRPVAFACECGDDGCGETVAVTPYDFDRLTLAGERVLARAHGRPIRVPPPGEHHVRGSLYLRPTP